MRDVMNPAARSDGSEKHVNRFGDTSYVCYHEAHRSSFERDEWEPRFYGSCVQRIVSSSSSGLS
jgi:hypothetical protein